MRPQPELDLYQDAFVSYSLCLTYNDHYIRFFFSPNFSSIPAIYPGLDTYVLVLLLCIHVTTMSRSMHRMRVRQKTGGSTCPDVTGLTAGNQHPRIVIRLLTSADPIEAYVYLET